MENREPLFFAFPRGQHKAARQSDVGLDQGDKRTERRPDSAGEYRPVTTPGQAIARLMTPPLTSLKAGRNADLNLVHCVVYV